MKKKIQILLTLVFVLGSFAYMQAQTFVGSQACQLCHPDKFTTWVNSGHPYKFSIVVNNQPPIYPDVVVNFEDTWMANLGDGTVTWNDVAGVIGGFGWKARFVGKDGYVVGTAGSAYATGVGHNQFNFYNGVNHGWVDYDKTNEHKMYNYSCFKCHTTGGDTTGTWLAGVEGLGNFSEGGIGCESCHGPGSEHVAAPSTTNIDRVYEFAHQDNPLDGLEVNGVIQHPNPDGNDVNFLCGTCHNRDYKNPINASGGFIRHHEQWDEFTFTKHYAQGLTCLTCHNPHKRTIWDGDGVILQCASCHATQVATTNHVGNATCIDCHMPFAVKSGTQRGQSGYKADDRSHLLKITDDTASMFTSDGKWVRNDEGREASLSPAFSCLGCHNDYPNDSIPDMTLEQAVTSAKDMHEFTSVFNPKSIALGLYPNPSNGITNISFNLNSESNVNIKVFNAAGQLVYSTNELLNAGEHSVIWNSTSNTGLEIISGYYFVKVTSGTLSSTQKLVLVR